MSEIKARRQHVTNMKYENRKKHPLPPTILLSLVPCIINHWFKSRNEMQDHAKCIKRLKELYKMNYQVTKNNKIKQQTRSRKTDLIWLFLPWVPVRRFGSRFICLRNGTRQVSLSLGVCFTAVLF